MKEVKRMTKFIVLVFSIILLHFEICFCKSQTLTKNQKIVIIGAGPAGIAAASKLLENGFTNITILEAEGRIGGRIYTTQFGNYSVDLGAQWVHGQEGNVAYDLAYPLGLLEKSDNPEDVFEQEYIDSSGNHLPENLSKKLSIFLIKYVFEVEFNVDTDEASIGEYVEKMFHQEFEDNEEVLHNKEKYLHSIELMKLTADSAESWYNISTIGSEEYKECPGDQMINWKERGYSMILDILMKRYPRPEEELPVLNNTVMNTEVKLIDYSNINGLPILIFTENGQLHKADHVIVTVSLGCLKEKHTTLFIPPLPKDKVNAIENLGFGSVTKIYLLFDKPFWNLGNRRSLRFAFLWNDADRKIIEASSEKKWLLGIFCAMTVEHKPNLLELWSSGKYAKEMETISESKVFNYTTETLHRFLDKIYNITDPVAMLRTQWYSNPHFKGTYSYSSVDSKKRNVHPEILEKPLSSKLNILFAGEATSINRFSTVDGAIASGWKAANRLIDYYKN